jgi:hypothetical protein
LSRAAALQKEMRQIGRPEIAQILQRFFKTGPGQYGEGDVFLGIKIPPCRELAKKYRDLPLSEVVKLLKSKIHEERTVALMILVLQFKKGDEARPFITFARVSSTMR